MTTETQEDLLSFSEAVYALERELKKRMGSDAELIEVRKGGSPNEYVILWRDENTTESHKLKEEFFHTHAMWILDEPAGVNMEWGHYDMTYQGAVNDFLTRVPHRTNGLMVD